MGVNALYALITLPVFVLLFADTFLLLFLLFPVLPKDLFSFVYVLFALSRKLPKLFKSYEDLSLDVDN